MNRGKVSIWCVVAVILSAAIVMCSVHSVIKYKELSNASAENVSVLEQKIVSNMRSGYVALMNISAGETISESMLTFSTQIVSDIDQVNFMDSSDIGKVAKTSLTAGMPVYKGNLSDESAEQLRERECSFIWLSSNLKDYDFVDVRILFRNGEDYIVAAKKPIYDTRISVNDVFLRLTEEEIQLLDSAIVDANMHDAKIYVTKYTNPEVQEASVVTYSPNSDVMRVIANDANIVERSEAALSVDARAAMDKRMQLFEEAYPDFKLEDQIGSSSLYDETFFNPATESEVQ